VVFGCVDLAIPCTNMFCCLLLITFNVESKCNYKGGNSTFVTFKFKKTLLTMSITSSSIVDWRCSMSYRLIFCPCSSYVVSLIQSLYLRLLCLGIIPPYATSCKVPISLTIELSTMFKWSILKTFMTCLCYQGQSHCRHSKVGTSTIHSFSRWLVDATNAMSSTFECKRTFVSKISWAHKKVLATMPYCIFFSHIWKFCITPCTNSEF
jgi:hypothetical protein